MPKLNKHQIVKPEDFNLSPVEMEQLIQGARHVYGTDVNQVSEPVQVTPPKKTKK
jgi:hypothetical protein